MLYHEGIKGLYVSVVMMNANNRMIARSYQSGYQRNIRALLVKRAIEAGSLYLVAKHFLLHLPYKKKRWICES